MGSNLLEDMLYADVCVEGRGGGGKGECGKLLAIALNKSRLLRV